MTEELKGDITAAAENITEETLAAFMENFSQHHRTVLGAQGSRIECYMFYDTNFINVSAMHQ
jgi:hypothetical protein